MTAMTTRPAMPVRAERDGFGQLLHAEWTKFRTVRGWVIGMIARRPADHRGQLSSLAASAAACRRTAS